MKKNSVAIIGMSCILPQIKNLHEYWNTIIDEINNITDIPLDRWDINDYYHHDKKMPDKTYSKRGGFMPDIDFDPIEYGLPPNILELTDVSQLLSLIVAKSLFEDAGYSNASNEMLDRTGVILGVGGGQKLITPLTTRLQYPIWQKVLQSCKLNDNEIESIIEKMKKAYVKWEENSFPGLLGNVISGRVANKFNLGGTNCVVDAACGSSLAAVKMAVSDLLEYRSDMIITGGVDTDNSPFMYMCFSKTPAFTTGMNCRPFDKDSDGMLIGEGIGMVMLKRLDDAVRDNDRIYSVIKGIGTSSDGKSKSIYAPSSQGQVKALRRAYSEADFKPSSVSLIEAHGTGTTAGDPVEFTALNEVFSEKNDIKQHIALGSIKSQIGHTKSAAGIASLIKVSLALHHKVLPATINVKSPNPLLNIESSPFYLNTKTRPWFIPQKYGIRRAGVSAFGFGGTNFHVALEEHVNNKTYYKLNKLSHSVILFDDNTDTLIDQCKNVLHELKKDNSQNHFKDLCEKTLSTTIPYNSARIGIISESKRSLISNLELAISTLDSRKESEYWELPNGIYFKRKGIQKNQKVVALFSGQGSQYLEMAKEVIYNHPEFYSLFEKADALFAKDDSICLSKAIFPIPSFDDNSEKQNKGLLQNTKFAQPAIGVISKGLYNIVNLAGFAPDIVAGHSFGELTALHIAGVIDEDDYLYLAKERGNAMSSPGNDGFDTGTMVAVVTNLETIIPEIKNYKNVSIANINSANQIVIAGGTNELLEIKEKLSKQGIKAIQLPVSAAFHTKYIEHGVKPFSLAIDKVTFNKPQYDVYSNSTASKYPNKPEEIKSILKKHLLEKVNFSEEIENIYNAGGYIFVEIGPKNILTSLVDSILKNKDHFAIALNRADKGNSERLLREAVTKLKVIGVSINEPDPYRNYDYLTDEKAKSPVAVKLNGANYINPKTKKEFEEALNDGFEIRRESPVHSSYSKSEFHSENQNKPTNTISEVIMNNEYSSLTKSISEINSSNYSEIGASNLNMFHDLQVKSMDLHKEYLKNNKEYVDSFYKLLSNSTDKLSTQDPSTLSNINSCLDKLHHYQNATLQIHSDFIKNIDNNSKQILNFYNIVKGNGYPDHREVNEFNSETGGVAQLHITSPNKSFNSEIHLKNPVELERNSYVIEEKTTKSQANETKPADKALVSASLLDIVSKKTGYPVEMLNLEMDIEADLGIDSIKRVEIFAATTEKFPGIPQFNPDELSELRTLSQIVEKITQACTSQTSANTGNNDKSNGQRNAVNNSKTSVEELNQLLLQVVSEKTGYPVEMLNLGMDIEADLGIDSIKRVEIFAAITERFPGIPQFNPDELSELRTLSQVVEKITRTFTTQVSTSPSKDKADVQHDSVNSTKASIEELNQLMLHVVGEKTGYPVELLKPDMNMESDLGIDSIKRVEILAAITERYPSLPQLNPDELSEFKTLEQISNHLCNSLNGNTSIDESKRNIKTGKKIQPNALAIAIPKLVKLPKTDRLDTVFSKDTCCVITNDGTSLTSKLADALIAKGIKIVILGTPGNSNTKRNFHKEVHYIKLKENSEGEISKVVKEISDKYGSINGFIHLDNSMGDTNNLSDLSLQRTFLLAKYLKENLNHLKEKQRNFFLVVSQMDGYLGLQKPEYSPFKGGFIGLVKTLNLEWADVYCRFLDLARDFTVENKVKSIIDELFDTDLRVTEIGVNQSGRFTLTAEKIELNKNHNESINDLSKVYLAIGGARGITADCIKYYSKNSKNTFILIGRSNVLQSEPLWALDCIDLVELKRRAFEFLKNDTIKAPTPKDVERLVRELQTSREIIETLHVLNKNGCKASYYSLDIRNKENVKTFVDEIYRTYGNITGIIHGAGVLADKLIEKKTVEDYNSVIDTKILGIEHVLDAVDKSKLEHIILFSSVAGFYGNVGQSDYSIANEILNKLAFLMKRENPKAHVVSFNWGPWDGGMVSADLKKNFEEKGIQVIAREQGVEIFAAIVGNHHNNLIQYIIGGVLSSMNVKSIGSEKKVRIIRSIKLKENPFLEDHVLGGFAVLPTVCALAWMADSGEKQYPGYTFFSYKNYQLLKGIVFEKNVTENYFMDIEEKSHLVNEEVVLFIKIYSFKGNDDIVNHYSSEIILKRNLPSRQFYNEFNLEEDNVVDGKIFYENKTCFHGKSFNGIIKQLNISPEKITMLCKMPEINSEMQGVFPVGAINPYATDLQFQCLGIIVRHYFDAASLPSKVEVGEHFADITNCDNFYISVDVTKKTNINMVANITAHDTKGMIYFRMIGAEVVASKNLKKQFEQNIITESFLN